MSFLSEYENKTIDVIDEVVNNLFIVDFFLNFITAVEENGKVESGLSQIAYIYLKGWLFIDMFACFPFDYVTPLLINTEEQDSSAVSDTNNLARLAKLPRFYRLVRVVRLLRLLKMTKNLNYIFNMLNIHKGVGKLITVLIAVLFITHMVACVWYWINEQTGFEPDGWVVRQDLLESSTLHKYISAVYWTFQTFTTVGYGDIPAVTLDEKIFGTIWMIGGFGFYSYTIGNFQSILNEIDADSYTLQQKQDTMNEFAKRTFLPPHLLKDIRRFIDNNSSNTSIIP